MSEESTPVVVTVLNQSSMLDGAFKKLLKALQYQIERDYNTSAWVKLSLAPKASLVTGTVPGAWSLTLLDHGNGSGGEGWHEEGEDGSIKGFVNYAVCHATGIAPSLIASHECIEMLVRGVLNNPVALREYTDPSTGDTWRLEVCDPVIDTAYEVMERQVSDFVEPAWYGIPDGLPFAWYSCRQTVSAPHELGPRGYTEVERAGEPGVWTQLTGS